MTVNGLWWSSAFFVLLVVAALTSGFAVLEPSSALLSSRWGISRRTAAWVVGASAWALGWVSIYSFSEPTFSFYYFGEERVRGYFDLFNILATHVLLPLTALLIALFSGWRMSKTSAKEALAIRPALAHRIWRLCIRFVAPTIISIVLLLVLFFPA
jgi:NSS family neurotransmitter:Na+ symporter